MNSVSNTRYTPLLISLAALLLLPGVAWAGIPYQPLVGIPGVDNAASNFNQYINQLYFVSISIAALLAVIKIIIGGVKWMLTDVVTQKSDAKNDIRSALLGLLLIIAAVLILGTINPQLTNLSVLQDAPPINLNRQNAEQFGPPAPVNPNGAENTAPIQEVRNADGTVTRSVSFADTLSGADRQNVQINGSTVSLPVIDTLRLQQFNLQAENLRTVTCSNNGQPGRTEGVDPVQVLVRNGTRVNGNPITIYTSHRCI